MNNPLGNFADEAGEAVKETTKSILVEAKKQVLAKTDDQKDGKKVDPTTNRPIPTKKVLTQLTQATTQLQQARLKKVREELEKQRLKVTDKDQIKKGQQGAGPDMPVEKPKQDDDVVATTMRNASQTGEMGRNVGG
jgi:hypothetical protein